MASIFNLRVVFCCITLHRLQTGATLKSYITMRRIQTGATEDMAALRLAMAPGGTQKHGHASVSHATRSTYALTIAVSLSNGRMVTAGSARPTGGSHGESCGCWIDDPTTVAFRSRMIGGRHDCSC